MKTILSVFYSLSAAVVLLCGHLYPAAHDWSYAVAGALGIYLILSLVVAACPVADAGRIATWFWNGLSALGTAGLLLGYYLRGEAGWLLAAAALTVFSVVVTVVFCLVLRPGKGIVEPHG